MESKKSASIHPLETDLGDHYSVNLKDERGKTVSTQVVNDLNEARQLKERWETGKYSLLTEA